MRSHQGVALASNCADDGGHQQHMRMPHTHPQHCFVTMFELSYITADLGLLMSVTPKVVPSWLLQQHCCSGFGECQFVTHQPSCPFQLHWCCPPYFVSPAATHIAFQKTSYSNTEATGRILYARRCKALHRPDTIMAKMLQSLCCKQLIQTNSLASTASQASACYITTIIDLYVSVLTAGSHHTDKSINKPQSPEKSALACSCFELWA